MLRGIRGVSPGEEKEGFATKEAFKPGMKDIRTPSLFLKERGCAYVYRQIICSGCARDCRSTCI